jgi:uncharacterized protein HemY
MDLCPCPGAVADPALLVTLSERATKAFPRSILFHRTHGATLLRAGKHEAAVASLKTALSIREEPATWLLLALAHHHLGHSEEARQWLDRAVRWMEKPPAKPPAGTILTWDEKLALQLLRKEAEALLKPPEKK